MSERWSYNYDNYGNGGFSEWYDLECNGHTVGRVEEEEHARLIIKACNAHDKLVAALKKIVTGFQPGDYDGRLPGEANLTEALEIVIGAMRDCAEDALVIIGES